MRILLLEDNPDDADLLDIALSASGLACTLQRVASADAFRAALAGFAPDLVVSDANIPGFSCREALALVRERDPAMPFVVVSGVDEQDLPSWALPHGADAWLCKDRMQDVAPTLRRLARRDARAPEA